MRSSSESPSADEFGFGMWNCAGKIGKLAGTFCECICPVPGVYALVYHGGRRPSFLSCQIRGIEFSPYSPDYLKGRWVPSARVLYFGKAGGHDQATNLNGRVRSYLSFWTRPSSPHRGGRAVWQIPDVHMCDVYWREADGQPSDFERTLLKTFFERYGGYPFANVNRHPKPRAIDRCHSRASHSKQSIKSRARV
jgi:hypothetical protein